MSTLKPCEIFSNFLRNFTVLIAFLLITLTDNISSQLNYVITLQNISHQTQVEKDVYSTKIKRKLHFKTILSDNDTSMVHNTLSLGLGLTKAFPLKNDLYGDNGYRFLFSTNATFVLYRTFCLNAGVNIHQTELTRSSTNLDIFIVPAFRFNLPFEKVTSAVGAGPMTTLYFGREGNITIGILTFFKVQYKLDYKTSIGIEFSHPEYFGAGLSKYFVLRSNIYILLNLL